MTARLKGRRRRVERLLSDITRWAQRRPDVDAVVVLAADPGACSAGSGWFERLRPGSRLVRTATWGPVREQRHRLRCGLLVEVGLAPLSWADVPLDAGTGRVLGDGHRVLHDPHGTLARARAAL